MARRATQPREGALPVITYTYDEGAHVIKCECKATMTTTEVGPARYFASSHTAEHARHRIVDPEVDA